MTIDELLEQLEEAREYRGGDCPVKIAYQQSYPLRGNVAEVTYSRDAADIVPHDYDRPAETHDEEKDAGLVWLAVGSADYDENPYGPDWAWSGEPPAAEDDQDYCGSCGRTESQPWDGKCETCAPAGDIRAEVQS
jgi:hypothetical protein